MGVPAGQIVPSGWDALDHELPGGGWPCGALTEVLSPQPGTLEWRLLAGALQHLAADGGTITLIGPPRPPFLPGLLQLGLTARQLLWIRAETVQERLWAAEQLLQADGEGALLAWLPQARPEQLRRLHHHAQHRRLLVVALRPDAARLDASPAPLRVSARLGAHWSLHVHVLKRRGPAHDTPLELQAIPGGLRIALPPRLLRPQASLQPLPMRGAHVVGRVAPSPAGHRTAVLS